jgi:release factor glutamine methyltransferase
MTLESAKKYVFTQLEPLHGNREAKNMADMLMEALTGYTRTQQLLEAKTELTTEQQQQFENQVHELLQHRPIQYVLGRAWFGGHAFVVNESVLIPRPETEELVVLIAEEETNAYRKNNTQDFILLDAGTGSGCIAICLKEKMPLAQVWGTDNSSAALATAKQNSLAIGVDIEWRQLDMSQPDWAHEIPVLDVLVSNPPYIPPKEAINMQLQVVNYEPHNALFTPTDDVLFFYRCLAEAGLKKLKPGGRFYVEVEESLAKQTANLFAEYGYTDINIKTDLQGKERMVMGRKD